MGSTNVPNKKQVKNERDNPTSANNILRDAHGNPVIAMQKGSYQTVKESQTKRNRYTRTKRTVQRVDETR